MVTGYVLHKFSENEQKMMDEICAAMVRNVLLLLKNPPAFETQINLVQRTDKDQ
jgi:peptidyl-tRNA hydrolase